MAIFRGLIFHSGFRFVSPIVRFVQIWFHFSTLENARENVEVMVWKTLTGGTLELRSVCAKNAAYLSISLSTHLRFYLSILIYPSFYSMHNVWFVIFCRLPALHSILTLSCNRSIWVVAQIARQVEKYMVHSQQCVQEFPCTTVYSLFSRGRKGMSRIPKSTVRPVSRKIFLRRFLVFLVLSHFMRDKLEILPFVWVV